MACQTLSHRTNDFKKLIDFNPTRSCNSLPSSSVGHDVYSAKGYATDKRSKLSVVISTSVVYAHDETPGQKL